MSSKVFKLPIHYFDRKLHVVVDQHWEKLLPLYGNYSNQNYSTWSAGAFTTKKGDYLICFRNPTPGEIAHEVTHILHMLYEEHGYNLNQNNDEMFCYMLGHFVNKIYEKVTT